MKVFPAFLPLLTVLLLLIFYLTLPGLNRCLLPGEAPSPAGKGGRHSLPSREDRSRKLSRGDLLPMLAITLLYACTAFFRLGDTVAPQTFAPMGGRDILITLPDQIYPSRILMYHGVGMGSYELSFSADGEEFFPALTVEQDHVAVLKWRVITPDSPVVPRAIRIRGEGELWLGEIVILDGDGQTVPIRCGHPNLCDEQETAPVSPTFQNSSYFDEIYHARTAWEHLHRVWPYEITHPPLGKVILGIGISLFGMTPFGWRFSGTFFGVLMLPLLYVFLKKLFGGRMIPILGTILFATDFMHYVQTRIATIDTYAVFFILLMYLFLYLWLTEDRLWALALCGVSFGLGAASKWTSIYAGAGLAVLWAARWIRRFAEARRENAGEEVFFSFLKNCLFCVVFFLLIPGLIYYFSYLPYGIARQISPFSRSYAAMVVNNQLYMLDYHSKGVLGATHPYSSNWYQWLVDYRPILYVLETPTPDKHVSIAAWLNPVLCWGGLLSLPVLGWTAIRRRDGRAAFILVGYLSELLPWVPVARLTFAYHYFPSSLFLVLSMSYVLCLLRENRARWRASAVALAAGSALLFLLFFPVLNGLPISDELATALYRWLPSWPL